MTARLPIFPPERPVTRGDCAGGERPCVWVSCRYNLLLDRSDAFGSRGHRLHRLESLRRASPDEAEAMVERLAEEAAEAVWSCALDVADQGGVSDASSDNDGDEEAEVATPQARHGHSDHALADIADAMGITRERVRQLEAIGMRRFRYNAAALGLAVELGGHHGRR